MPVICNLQFAIAVTFLASSCSAIAVPAPQPAPTVTLLASTAAPTVAVAHRFRASFDNPLDGQLQVGSTANATFAVNAGRYSISVRQANAQVWSSFGESVGDGTVEIDLLFRPNSPPLAAGLMFRMQNDRQFYLASLSSDGFYALDARDKDGWHSLIEWTRDQAIDTRGGVNRLKIVTSANLISLYLNDKLLSQTTDGAFARGGLALSVTTYDQANVTVDFDNVVVTPDS